MKRILLAGLLALAAAAPVLAHDFWVQPRAYWLADGRGTPTGIMVGHGGDRQAWALPVDRIAQLRVVSAKGSADQKGVYQATPLGRDVPFLYAAPGVNILVLESKDTESELPGLRFTDYLKEEGLTLPLKAREKARKTNAPGREIYSRRAKALVQVGPAGKADDALVTRPVGLTLEVVPERNPYTLAPNQPLPVRILYQGKPLAGATVKLTNLDFDARPVAQKLSDAQGRTSFDVPSVGNWLVNVIWSRPISGNPRGDYETVFSSLTFGYPRGKVQ